MLRRDRAHGRTVDGTVRTQTLKNNNARLKTALQESASNVEEWKTQLTAWKEECIRLRAQVKELRASGGSAAAAEVDTLKEQLAQLQGQVAALEGDKSRLESKVMVRTLLSRRPPGELERYLCSPSCRPSQEAGEKLGTNSDSWETNSLASWQSSMR